MKIIEFFKNWFEKNGLIKFLIAFALLIISILVIRNTHTFWLMSFFNIVGLTSLGYIVLTTLVFTIAGIVNSIKDLRK